MKKQMHIIARLLVASLFLSLSSALFAGGTHDHGDDHGHEHHHKEAGPNGGRIIDSVEPRFEFFVTADNKVQITFLNKKGEPIAPGEEEVSLVGGDRSSPTKLAFVKKDGVLLSTTALPEGNNYPVILTIKTNPFAKAVREKFSLNRSDCPSCEYQEYACVCGH